MVPTVFPDVRTVVILQAPLLPLLHLLNLLLQLPYVLHRLLTLLFSPFFNSFFSFSHFFFQLILVKVLWGGREEGYNSTIKMTISMYTPHVIFK